MGSYLNPPLNIGCFMISFEKFIDKVFWALLLGVVSYGVGQVRSVTDSINELNTKMSVVILQLSNQSKILDSHEQRLLFLERRTR